MEWIPGAISSLFNQFTILFSGFVLLTLLVHTLLFNRRIRRYRSDYHRLKEQEKESRVVLQHRNQLRDRTKSYEQSLTYAQRIQTAMFITPKQLRAHFPESFIYHRPKEIVSGDFNWAKRINGRMLFSVADCTGHGVPGAFMSLIGLEFFRQITMGKGIIDPAGILNEMNRQFDIVFRDTEELSLKDGIDLALCAYDYKNRVLEYAGAFNPLYIVRDQEILEIKGDRIIVGPDNGLQRGIFENRRQEIKEDDMLYMFTDGYADQFGGPEGKKFKYRRFRHLLMSIYHLSMADQLKMLEENMNDWMGSREDQIDDQTIIGIRPASFSSS
ncbi:MAG: SpoIIE family protein phosphatase [Bacteroidales bacterium]|nr:SpoIIE family protein phosphatase [Bacteroidales bacterium]